MNKEKQITRFQFILQMISIGVIIIGFFWYARLKKSELDSKLLKETNKEIIDKLKWSWNRFFFSKESCKGDGLPSMSLSTGSSDD